MEKIILINESDSCFKDRSSLRRLAIVSETNARSLAYLSFKLFKANSAEFLFDFKTVRNVAICSRFVDKNDFNLITCSCNSITSSMDAVVPCSCSSCSKM